MSVFSLACAYLKARLSYSVLHVVLMMLGVMMMTMLLLFSHQARERLYRDGAGIDAVVGAKGSPLQLILSSVMHMDIPTGNITLADADSIKKHRQVKQVISLALGDNYCGFRIVGTEPAYVTHFAAEFAEGELWQKSMQAVIGAKVARETGLRVGNAFVGVHGLLPSGHGHDDHPYRVVGVLEPTGTVLDRLIVTSLDSVWDAHGVEGKAVQKDAGDKEVTALLVKYRSRAAALSFPRQINQQTSMQAASPAFEMARLIDLAGVGTDMMMSFGGFLVAVSLVSVFIGLLNAIGERRYDLAIFRSLGASRRKIFQLVLVEGMIIALLGSVLGLLLGHGAMEILGSVTDKGMEMGLEGFIFLAEVWWLWLLVMVMAFVACVIPAWGAYRTEIRTMLTHG